MKRLAFLALTALFSVFLLPFESLAQNRSYSSSSYSSSPRFVIGLAPISLLTRSGKANIHAEWAYADNKSLSFLVAVPRNGAAPRWLADDVTIDGQGRTITNTFNAFGIIAENRFYFAKNAPRGFYLAPYLRYNRMWLDHVTENPEGQGQTKLTGMIAGFGGGGAMGWQIPLGNHLTIDLTAIGLDFKWMRGDLTYSTTDPENDIAAFRDEVQQTVEDIPFIGAKLAAAVEGDQVKVRTPGMIFPAVRFNVSVNYAF